MAEKDPALTFRMALSSATRTRHEATEAVVSELSVFSSEPAYAGWLKALQEMHAHFASTSDFANQILGMEATSAALLSALRHDMDQLGVAPTASPSQPLTPSDPAIALGVGYVLEGSGLGASVLYDRSIAAGISAVRYLDLSRSLARQRWRTFLERLNEHALATAPSVETASSAADDVFIFLAARLEQNAPARPHL